MGKRLEQQNFHKFLRWIACTRIRLLTDRIDGAAWEARRIKDIAEHATACLRPEDTIQVAEVHTEAGRYEAADLGLGTD